ncbi:MAG: hypothetical protein EB037_08225 [Actinobacteria bacterium]|nr:hypothetical protein [Actinomycetota bacterium]
MPHSRWIGHLPRRARHRPEHSVTEPANIPKLVALDVDGTLLDAAHRVSDRTARAIAEVRRRNIVVAIATGRPVEVIGAPAEHADWLIGSNGATVVHAESRRVIVDRDISVEHARLLATRIRAAVGGVRFSVISERDAVYEAGFELIVPGGVSPGRLVTDALTDEGVVGERVRSWAADWLTRAGCRRTDAGDSPPVDLAYSTRRPEIARAITSCWISEVPSKMVWILASRCMRSTWYSRVYP